MLKCYFGGSTEPVEYDFVDVCFARTAKEAKKIMWDRGLLAEECEHDWIASRVVRQPRFDSFLDPKKTDAYIVNDTGTLRAMGWSLDGDNHCITCGLATMDEAYPVCGECENCSDCGHDDECSDK